MSDPNLYLTTKELADLLRVKERKVYELAAASEVPFTRVTGKLLFPRHLIEAWLARHTEVSGDLVALPDPPAVAAGAPQGARLLDPFEGQGVLLRLSS